MAVPYFTSGDAGRAYEMLLIERWQEAADGFRKHRATLQKPEHEGERARTDLLIAVADAGLGDWAKAAAGFEAAAEALPLVADYAHYHAARAYYFAHDQERAMAHTREVGAGSIFEMETRMLQGDILRAQGKWPEVLAHYKTYLGEFPSGMRRAEARFRIGEAQEQLGKPREALEAYRQVMIRNPVHPFGEQAKARFDELLKGMSSAEQRRLTTLGAEELLTRGDAYFEAMRNAESEADYAKALDAGLSGKRECYARFQRAQSVFKNREYTRAAPLFDDAMASCEKAGDGDLMVKAAYQAGRSWENARPEKLQRAIARFAQAEAWARPRGHSYADDARIRQARVWKQLAEDGEAGAQDKVTELLSNVPELYPDGDMRADAMWWLAWRAYQDRKYTEAIGWLDKQIATVPHDTNYWAEGQAFYWKARALEKLGKRKEALAAYEACLAEYPLSYYSLLTLNRLRESYPDDFKRVRADLDEPPKGWTAGTPVFRFQPRKVYGEEAFLRAIEYLKLGLGLEAERELARLGFRVPGGRDAVTDPDRVERLWAAALLYHRARRFDRSHWILRYAVTDYKRSWPNPANREKWEIAYPRGYWHLIEPSAKREGYPPELLVAIVREESAFNPLIESYANAVGLTQMIFPTARRFGGDLGFPITRENLRDPEKNVAIGSRFLGFLWRSFHGNVGLLVPAYNAGENAVWRWLCRMGSQDRDEFSEGIAGDQARGYTKRVIGSYFAYSYIYGGTIPEMPNEIPKAAINPKRCR